MSALVEGKATASTDLLCDFCHAKGITWEYPANTFLYKPGMLNSISYWLVCSVCRPLVDIRDWPGMFARVASLDPAVGGASVAMRAQLQQMLLGLWHMFDQNRTTSAPVAARQFYPLLGGRN